jgi:hypothetical protein
MVFTFLEPIYGPLLPVAAFAFVVILVVIATPVRAAVAADSLRKDRRATLGLRVTLRPSDTAPAPEEVLILLLAIGFSPY